MQILCRQENGVFLLITPLDRFKSLPDHHLKLRSVDFFAAVGAQGLNKLRDTPARGCLLSHLMKVLYRSSQLWGEEQSFARFAFLLKLESHFVKEDTTLILHFEGPPSKIILILYLLIEPAVRVE